MTTKSISRRFLLGGVAALSAVAVDAAAAGPGRLAFGRGGGAPPGFDYVVANRAQLLAVLALGSATLAGKSIGLQDGGASEYGTAIIPARGLTPATQLYIASVNVPGNVRTPGFDFENSANILVADLEHYRLRNVGGSAPGDMDGVTIVRNAPNIKFRRCWVHSDVMANADLTGYMRVENVTGTFIDGLPVVTSAGGTGYYRAGMPSSSPTNFAITGPDPLQGNASGGIYSTKWLNATLTQPGNPGASATIKEITSNVRFLVGIYGQTSNTPSHGLEVSNCLLENVKWGVGASGTDMLIQGNTIRDFYANPMDFNSDCSRLKILANRCIDGWAQDTDGEPSGTNGPHSSVLGFSFASTMVDDVLVEGNILAIGTARARAGKGQAFATGPKINDMEITGSGSITLDVLNMTSLSSALPSFTLKPGMPVYGPGVAPGTVITQVLTGSGRVGTYRVSISQTVPANTLQIQSVVNNFRFLSNIVDANGSIGFEFDFVQNSLILYNTIFSSRDVAQDAMSLYYANVRPGCIAGRNILISTTVGQDSRYVSPDFFVTSYANLQLVKSETSGPASYEGNFTGVGGPTPFSGLTLENAVQMVTPLPGSPASRNNVGATAYYDWDTNTASYPAWTYPTTSLPTGVDMPFVAFDGTTTWTRWNAVGADPLLDITNPNQISFGIVINMRSADTSEVYLLTAGNSDIFVRRLTNSSTNKSRLRFLFKGAGGAQTTFDSSFSLTQADGRVVIWVSVDFAAFKVFLWKGAVMDPFVKVNSWPGAPLQLTARSITLAGGATTVAGNLMQADVAACLVTDGLLDGDSSAAHSRLVAQDGKPANWGSNGQLVLPGSVRAYLAGVASLSTWNNPAGFQLGTAPGVSGFLMRGTVTNAP